MQAVARLIQPTPAPRRAQSLNEYLSEIAERHDVAHLVVTDEGGLLFASARDHERDEEIAALAPHRASGELSINRLGDAPTIARKVRLEDAILYVAACGEVDRCEAAAEELEPLLRHLLEM